MTNADSTANDDSNKGKLPSVAFPLKTWTMSRFRFMCQAIYEVWDQFAKISFFGFDEFLVRLVLRSLHVNTTIYQKRSHAHT